MIINGGLRKKDFINSLNGKMYCELSNNLKKFIITMFPKIKMRDRIVCLQKNGRNINISVTVNSETKNVALKSGNTSVVFKDYIYNFMVNLALINVPMRAVSSIFKYHKGYSSNTDFISFGSMLKEDFKEEIKIVREEFQNPQLLSDFIDVFIMKEKSGKKVDFFYYGNYEMGFTISSNDLKFKLINDQNNYPHDFMRIGPFNFLPVNRNEKTGENTLCQLRINNFYKYFK